MRRLAVAVILVTAGRASADVDLPTVMDRRWSATLAYGASSLRAQSGDVDAQLKVAVDMGLRLRLWPELEVGALLTGAVDRAGGYAAFAAEVRYRFLAEQPWSPFVAADVGAATWESRGSWHPLVRGGVGIERRFASWGFSLDARIARVSGDDSMPIGDPDETLAHFGAWDASASLAAVYYWGRGRSSHRLVP